MPEGHWHHNQHYEASIVAYEQGIELDEFRSRSHRAQANAFATRRVKVTMEAYDQHLQMKKMRKPRRKG